MLDVGSSSADHFDMPPDELNAFGGDLDQQLPYGDDVFDDVLCTGAVGALTRPRETFAELARVLRPGGRLVCTFASTLHVAGEVRGWVATDDAGRVRIVRSYFSLGERLRPGRERPANVAHRLGRPPVGGVGGETPPLTNASPSSGRPPPATGCDLSWRTPSHQNR